MVHDFKRFPELTNGQMQIYYFDSPHKQITEDFRAQVVKVTDGDTVRLKWSERDFDFPLRMERIGAPELDEVGGIDSQKWLSARILGEEVDILLSSKRVEKWGRLLGDIIHAGESMSDASMREGKSVNFFGSSPWA